jgi:NAD dependent epimerase/dehydratase
MPDGRHPGVNGGWKNRRVLVTGAGGFIGSHVVEALVSADATVTAFVHYNARRDLGNLRHLDRHVLDALEVVAGDVRDSRMVRKAMHGQEAVFHLAALIGIPYSYDASDSYVQTNVIGTLNVLEGALAEGVGKVVHTSTSEVYGTAQYVPIDEKHPLQAQSPYSASKIAADKLAESYYLSFHLPVTTVRPFNTFGPRQSARAVIPTILAQLAAKAARVKLGSLAPVRDFTFATDTAQGLLAVGLADDAVGQVTNLGTGVGISVGDLFERCVEVTGQRGELEIEAERLRPEASEVMRLISDNSVAARVANWRPRVSLDDGLVATYEFIRMHPEAYTPDQYVV